MGLFLGLWLGIAVARFRDLQPFVNSILGVAIFFCPVFYQLDSLSSGIRNVLLVWNPFTYLIMAFRAPLLGEPLLWSYYVGSAIVTVINVARRARRVHARPFPASVLGGVMAQINLGNVRAQYELLSVLDYNLKRRVVETIRRKAVPPVTIDALSGIDLEVADGSRLGLVGANGAGKSTLLAIMAGVLPPTSGSVEVHGRVLALLGGASEGLDQEATGRDNIVSTGVQLGETPAAMRKRIDDVTEFSGLAARIDHPVYSYSTGMQARLRFSILTSLRPDILLLDEGLGTADAEFATSCRRAASRVHVVRRHRRSRQPRRRSPPQPVRHRRLARSRACTRAGRARHGLGQLPRVVRSR